MKALLLAAGLGTRLRPLTNDVPKCLMEIGDQPLLGHWLDALFGSGIDSILVNLHHHSEQVKSYVEARLDRSSIHLVYEKQLLGTAGTVRANCEFFDGEAGLVLHADNFCTANISKFICAHEGRPKDAALTMMTFVSDDPRSCGIVGLDEQGVVREFHEKVVNPPGNIANAAIYVFEETVIRFISESKEGELRDLSTDVIPRYLGRIYAAPADGVVIDVGTLANLERAKSYARDLAG